MGLRSSLFAICRLLIVAALAAPAPAPTLLSSFPVPSGLTCIQDHSEPNPWAGGFINNHRPSDSASEDMQNKARSVPSNTTDTFDFPFSNDTIPFAHVNVPRCEVLAYLHFQGHLWRPHTPGVDAHRFRREYVYYYAIRVKFFLWNWRPFTPYGHPPPTNPHGQNNILYSFQLVEFNHPIFVEVDGLGYSNEIELALLEISPGIKLAV